MNRLVLYGASLGSAMTTKLSSKMAAAGSPGRQVAAVVLVGAMSSALSVFCDPRARLLYSCWDQLDNESTVGALQNVPVLLMQGEQDRTTTVEAAVRLMDRMVEGDCQDSSCSSLCASDALCSIIVGCASEFLVY